METNVQKRDYPGLFTSTCWSLCQKEETEEYHMLWSLQWSRWGARQTDEGHSLMRQKLWVGEGWWVDVQTT